MKVCWMVPTFGRKPELLANCLACFTNQDYPLEDRMFLMYDDLGNIQLSQSEKQKLSDKNIFIVSSVNRCASLPQKYLQIFENSKLGYPLDGWKPDHYMVVDDDDIYLPWHTSSHIKCLTENTPLEWCYPHYVWSLYTGTHKLENSGGRFWASVSIRKQLLARVLPNTNRMDYDQTTIKNLGQITTPCRPVGVPSFCMRWGSTGARHASTGNPDNWYHGAIPQYTHPITRLAPIQDVETANVIATISQLTVNDLGPYLV